MFSSGRRRCWLLALPVVITIYFFHVCIMPIGYDPTGNVVGPKRYPILKPTNSSTSRPRPVIEWASLPQQFPVTSVIPLPTDQPQPIPAVQRVAPVDAESAEAKTVRGQRRQAVKEAFQHAWSGYKRNAWLKDEVGPLSGGYRNPLAGWAATLVDSLDTLWILGLYQDFEEAVDAVATIDFSSPADSQVNLFETTTRYLGGLLGAYDVSDAKYPVLLQKARQLGDMLYAAFDTPNRMPVLRWNWEASVRGQRQEASEVVLAAEMTSLSLEFTRLSQLTGDMKYYDAVQRISDELEGAQNSTKLPGMWPVVVNGRKPSFWNDDTFTLGGMSDSLYEYLLKEHLLLGGATPQYRELYESALETIKSHLLFRPMTLKNEDILFTGTVRANKPNQVQLEPTVQHLACFAGGMIGMGAKVFDSPEDLEIARKLVDGCIWAYEYMPTGIMPEKFDVVPCEEEPCRWDVQKWYSVIARSIRGTPEGGSGPEQARMWMKIEQDRLKPGITSIDDRRYLLRAEAIESVFILYRITGDTTLLDKAWKMFESIEKHTRTEIAHAALDDVTQEEPAQSDRMESFWLAETLKYFYLIFSEPELVSLDDYVLNTEAHPLKRP